MAETRVIPALLLMLIAGASMSAEELESLDEDFLAYLAEYEGDDDDWTIVEATPVKAPAKVIAKPPDDSTTAKAPTRPASESRTKKPASEDAGSKR